MPTEVITENQVIPQHQAEQDISHKPADVPESLKPQQEASVKPVYDAPAIQVIQEEPAKKLSVPEQYNAHIEEVYGPDVSGYLKKLEAEHPVNDYLARHDVSEAYRAKMVDWMVEVLSAFQCSDDTFFSAINYQDRFFKNTEAKIPAKELHLSGITAMFMSSKYHDILPLLMKTMVTKIAHKKFTSEQIVNREMVMLQTLGFKLGSPTHYEFLKSYMYKLTPTDSAQKEFLKKTSVYLAKLCCYDYKLSQQLPSLLGAACFYLAAKISEKNAASQFTTQAFLQELAKQAGVSSDQIIAVAKRLLAFSQNFDKVHPQLKNLNNLYATELTQLAGK